MTAQTAVANQRADHLAVRAGRQLELFDQRLPFLVAAVEPLPRGHAAPPPRKAAILPAWGRGGVVAGDEKAPGSGVRGIPECRLCRIPGVTTSRRLGRQFGKIPAELRPERGKGHLVGKTCGLAFAGCFRE